MVGLATIQALDKNICSIVKLSKIWKQPFPTNDYLTTDYLTNN